MNIPFNERRQHFLTLEWMRRNKGPVIPRQMPENSFDTCTQCGAETTKKEVAKNLFVCPHCGYHHKIGAYLRLSMLLDSGSFKELNGDLTAANSLNFPGYEEKLDSQRTKNNLLEGVITATGNIERRPVTAVVLDSNFMLGSMGVAVGEKITRAIEHAKKYKLPLIIFSASGGARMQEGILSLMQMAKTSTAIEDFKKSGGLYISFFTNPTTGGVTASFASLGDIILAEPEALIGFAGPRVIEQTIGQTLPEGFQRSEFLLEHGFLDQIVPRTAMRKTISNLLMLHGK